MYKRSTAKIIEVSNDLLNVRVKLPLSYKNKNYANSIFGGSMFSAVDPIPMVQLINLIGTNYIVWDKSADIDYIKPGKGTVTAEFIITDALIEDILAHTAHGEKYLPEIPVYVKDAEGEIVAKLNRTLYIRRKRTV